jgi:RNA polymerase sigma factor (sigma-70 family)
MSEPEALGGPSEPSSSMDPQERIGVEQVFPDASSSQRHTVDARQRDFAAQAEDVVNRLLRSRALSKIPAQDRYDVLQECLLGAWRRWDTIEKLDDEVRYAYIHQIAHHQMAKYFARKQRTRESSLEGICFDIKGTDEEIEEYLQHTAPEVWNVGLWQIVGRLPAQQRAVLLLRHLDGFSTKAVGALLGISESSVKTHLKRAISRVAELLQTEEQS